MKRTGQLIRQPGPVAAEGEQEELTVLLIDQSDEDIKSIKGMLSGNNIRVMEATDLDTGLSRVSEAVDVVLMDLYLPYSQGYDTFEVVSDYSVAIPIVVLTHNQDKELAMKAMRYGAQDYLFKETINGEVLVRCIRYAIERKKLVEEQRAIKSGLIRLNADLEQFAYIAANDLIYPLDSMIKRLRILKPDISRRPSTESIENYNIALEDATSMRLIINDLLDFSRVGMEGQPFVQFDMERALEAALDELRPSMERTGTTVIHGPLPTIIGDRMQMTLLLRNLINTAIRFRGKDPLNIRITAREDPKVWTFSVKDNGRGTPGSLRDMISGDFRQVFTGTAAMEYPGAGIELIISKRILERHGGSMRIVSLAEEGTVVHFAIPRDFPG